MEIILAILLGGFFGFALYMAGATNSRNLINMLSLRNLSLMKTILFAIGFSSFLLSLASLLGIFNISHLSVKGVHLGVLVGGLIFGIGFGWAGTCPGTCIAGATGADFKKAIATIIGGLLGALTFSLSYGYFEKLGLFELMNLGKLTIFNISDKYPSIFQIGFTGLMIMGIFLMLVAYMLPMEVSLNKK